MADWEYTEAEAKLEEVLDGAEQEGPQVVWRNGQEFLVLTEEQLQARIQPSQKQPSGSNF